MQTYLIDGTNVLFWASVPERKRDNGKTYLSILLMLLIEIKRTGGHFICFFDRAALYHAHDSSKIIIHTLLC